MIAALTLLCLAAAPMSERPPAPTSDAEKPPLAVADSQRGLSRYQYEQVHMGTRFRMVLYGRDQETANQAAQAAFDRITQLDKVLSDYDPQSEISRLSAGSPSPQPVRISDDLWPVLWQAQELARRSDGAFDATAGPLTTLWRAARRNGKLPADEALAAARKAAGYQHLGLNDGTHTARLLRGSMRIDLGGIAKGYAADEALAVLAKRGITQALVAAGGDIAVAAPPPGRAGWRIVIAPLRKDDGTILSPARTLLVAQAGVSTSGEAEQHVDIGGVRYSHIVDPRTGLGLTTHSSVTVVSPRGILSDGLATAVSVLGPTKGLELLAAAPGVQGLVVVADGDRASTHATRGFARLESAN